MSAWGTGSFENDDAADWVYELEESSGTDAVEAALEAIDPDDYPEAPDCNVAIAAAEVIAALRGHPLESLPAEVAAWVDENETDIDSDLVALALTAIQRIESDSELKELWNDADELDSWSDALRDLESRLNAS